MNIIRQCISELSCLGQVPETMLATIGTAMRKDLLHTGPATGLSQAVAPSQCSPQLQSAVCDETGAGRQTLVIVDHREEHVNLIREMEAWQELQTQTVDEIENDE